MMATARTYHATKLEAGRYLQVGNDNRTVWLIERQWFDDGTDAGVDGWIASEVSSDFEEQGQWLDYHDDDSHILRLIHRNDDGTVRGFEPDRHLWSIGAVTEGRSLRGYTKRQVTEQVVDW